MHGREHNLIPDVHAHKRVFLLTGGQNNVLSICHCLSEAGLNHLKITIGECLGSPEEKITQGNLNEILDNEYAALSVMLIENENPDAVVTPGLPDELFLRDKGSKGIVPMTKSEIRSICLSKLALTENACCWDIGSGTGSVAVEMALQARYGQIYAIEQDNDALELSRRNAERLSAGNITFVHGTAPIICENLPSPTHIFIGGSSGNLPEIFRELESRNSDMRIVVTAVTLDTIAQMNQILENFPITESETIMVQTALAKKFGSHQLMVGGNPVYIFSMRISGVTD